MTEKLGAWPRMRGRVMVKSMVMVFPFLRFQAGEGGPIRYRKGCWPSIEWGKVWRWSRLELSSCAVPKSTMKSVHLFSHARAHYADRASARDSRGDI